MKKSNLSLVIALAVSVFTLVVIFCLDHDNRESTPAEQAKYQTEDSLRIAYFKDTAMFRVVK